MALITDPDNLNQGTEVVFDTTAKTIELLEAGNLSNDGVTIKTVYSFTKEEWKDDSSLIKFDFPFTPVTDEFFELKDGWNWKNQGTRNLIRRGGFNVRDIAGSVTEHWVGVAILGAESDDQIYYDIGNGATDFVYTGNTAEVVQVISDPNGDGSYGDGFNLSTNLKAYNREQGQVYSFGSTSQNGEASLLAPKLFSITLNTGVDLKITETDANIATQSPYTGMSITYYETAESRTIGSTAYNFGIVIDGNNGTAEEIYEFVQYQLRQSIEVDNSANNSSQIGQLQDELLKFVGNNLETLSATNADGGGTGVYIDNFQVSDTNRITFVDNTDTDRTFPFVAGLTLNFNSNLVASSDAIYRVFFTDASGSDFDDSDAIIVNDESGTPISGDVNSNSSLSFTFDYDGNVQGGRTAGTDANITVVAIGTDNAQHVIATGTISRSNSNSVSLVSPLERNYENA